MIETLADLALTRGGFDMLAPTKRSESISSAIPGSQVYSDLAGGVQTFTNRAVNPSSALQYTAVWACIKILSECVSSLPLLTYRNVSPDGLVRNLAIDDYRYRMLREQPNDEMTSMQWREFGMASLLGFGNWYNYLDIDGRGRIKQIYPLRPESMIVLRNPRTMRLEYRYTPTFPYAVPVPPGVYEPWQILHVPGLGWDGIVGYSPITMMRNAIALGQAQEEYAGRFHANNARPSVALVSAATIKDPEGVRKEWQKTYGGLENTGAVAVLHGGLDLKTFSINPRDAQFLEGRSFQLAEIARIFNVPLGMLHDVLSKPETYASAEQADLRFVKYSVRPWCTRIEQKVNVTVLSSQDALTCRHDLTDLLRGDLSSQALAYNTLCNGGIMRRNEARVRLDLPPDPDPEADKLTVQAQVVPIGDIGKELLQPASKKTADPQDDPQD